MVASRQNMKRHKMWVSKSPSLVLKVALWIWGNFYSFRILLKLFFINFCPPTPTSYLLCLSLWLNQTPLGILDSREITGVESNETPTCLFPLSPLLLFLSIHTLLPPLPTRSQSLSASLQPATKQGVIHYWLMPGVLRQKRGWNQNTVGWSPPSSFALPLFSLSLSPSNTIRFEV